jgi:pimeloyl-ACP methyl ester carboxylesterase
MTIKKIRYKGINVSYRDQGTGTAILLLHGYLETGEIWESFTPLLTDSCRVICPDLPGHGKSGFWGKTHDLGEVAGSVKAVLEAEGLERVFLAGHSMGGYVTMAFADLYPESLFGYILFHSTCFADSKEKRSNRDREISLVMCSKKRQIINVNIPKAFADENLERLKAKVSLAKCIAMQNPDEGIIALLNGMKKRPDRTPVLEDPGLPLLLIGGVKDNYIPLEVFDEMAGHAPHADTVRLKESGHMGFFEEPGLSAAAIRQFMEKHGPAR